MKYELNLMVDLETFSLKQNASIVEFGARFFWLRKNGTYEILSHKYIDNKFCFDISLESNFDKIARDVNPETIVWWMKQAAQVKPAWVNSDNRLGAVLSWYSDWVRSALDELQLKKHEYNLWAHGSDFDPGIIVNAMRDHDCFEVQEQNEKQPTPLWDRRNVRDTRTLFDLVDFDYYQFVKQQNKKRHSAMDDVDCQILGVATAWKMLKGVV